MEEDSSSSILPSFAIRSVCMPDFNSISKDKWEATEAAIHDILNRISPTDVAQDKRSKIIAYIQRLIYNTVGVQVFPYGSVPLKTYLRDGDIDLTAIGVPGQEEELAKDVFKALSAESTNINAEFTIKEINMIDAKVKLVKCSVGDILTDISFNQLGGLCSLGFLEQIDRKIGQDHLFKRSIMLIKAWCYYESRILGAMHGLMSTYALEILVLYIFRMYFESLTKPLMVLYRFLQYYNAFDWQGLCITLDGPASVYSFPNIIVDNPIRDSVFGEEFLKMCQETYNVPSNGHIFNLEIKPFNIIDPLKDTNNLGRSISIGTSYRIKRVFNFGAKKLGKVMELPTDKIEAEVANFFKMTLEQNQSRYNPLSSIPLGDLSTVQDIVVVEWERDLDYESDKDNDDSIYTNSESIYDDGPTEGWYSSGKIVPTYESVYGENKPEKKLTTLLNSSDPEDKGLVKCEYQSMVKKLEDETKDLCKENEELVLSKFDGDYDGCVRNLVNGITNYCFSKPSRLFDVPDQPIPYGGYWQQEVGGPSTGPWDPQNQACAQQYPNVESVQHEVGGPSTGHWASQNQTWAQQYPNVEPMQPGTYFFDHETGMQFPYMGSPARGRGRGRGQPKARRQPHGGYEGTDPALDANHEGEKPRDPSPTGPAHLGAHTPKQGSAQRRLQFGSFSTVPNTSQNVEICEPERSKSEPLKLKNEEFPPLSG